MTGRSAPAAVPDSEPEAARVAASPSQPEPDAAERPRTENDGPQSESAPESVASAEIPVQEEPPAAPTILDEDLPAEFWNDVPESAAAVQEPDGVSDDESAHSEPPQADDLALIRKHFPGRVVGEQDLTPDEGELPPEAADYPPLESDG